MKPVICRTSLIVASLYILFALPLVILQVYATPPFQVADEDNHFLRAVQIASGHPFAERLDALSAGGWLDPVAHRAADMMDDLKFHPEVKVDMGAYARLAALQWGTATVAPASFPNTAIYPAFLYAPAVLGLAVGKAAGLSVLDSFYLGRLATALCAVGVATSALLFCGRGRTALFVILSFPMALSLFASLSQDAMAITFGALAAALWSHYSARRLAMPPWARATASLLIGAVAAARLPLLPLCILAFVPTADPKERRPGRRFGRADAAAALAGLLPLGFGVFGAALSKVAFRPDEGVSPLGQLAWMALHPLSMMQVAGDTLAQTGVDELREMVGVLGWLDTDLPTGFYTWMAVCLAVAVALDWLTAQRGLDGLWRWIAIVASLAASAGVFATFYLAWTPVGAPLIDGVQGRYFFAPAMVLAIALTPLRRGRSAAAPAILPFEIVFCIVVGLINLWIVPVTLLHRYYG